MNKKLLILIMVACLYSQSSSACDVCGCNLSGLYFGFMPIQNTHFIGIKYSTASFNAFIDNDDYYFKDEYSRDTYQRFDLIGRISLSKKFQLRYVLPYSVNNMNGTNQVVSSSGIGDPLIMAYFSPFNNGNDFTKDVMHSLSIGFGLKLPLGDFDKKDNGALINRNFQLGSGSLDYLMSVNYTIRYKKVGLNTESSYKINSKNNREYRFGNQYNVSGNVFYYIEMLKVSVLPFVGLYYEEADYHVSHGIKEANTGGSTLFGTMGAQLFMGKFTANCQYQIPIEQKFHTDASAQINGGNRFSLGVYYSFTFKKDKM